MLAQPSGTAVWRSALAAILSVLLFACTFALVALSVVRPETVSAAVARTDLVGALEGTDIVEEILKAADESPQAIPIDTDAIRDFLRRESVADEVSAVFERYATAVVDGDLGYHITSREVLDFLRAVAPDIRDEFDYRLTNDDYSAIIDAFANRSINLGDFTVDRLFWNHELTILFSLLSVYPMIVLGILSILFVFDIFLLKRRKIGSAFMHAGVPVALTGFIFAFSALLFGPFSGFLRNSSLFTAARAIAGIISPMLFTGLLFFAIGCVSIVVSVHMGKKGAGRQRNSAMDTKDTKKAWLIGGIAANAAAVVACLLVTSFFLLALP